MPKLVKPIQAVPKVARTFRAVRSGDIYPTDIEAGEVVEGRLAEIAAQLNCLEVEEVKPAAGPARRTKAARAPEVKTNAAPDA